MRLSLFIYFASLLFLTVFSYAFIDPNLLYLNVLYSGFHLEYREFSSIIYLFILTALFTSFFLIINNKSLFKLPVKKIILLTIIVLFLSYPAMLSYDIFNYITTAKVTFSYLENPYIIYPVEFIGEPYLEFTRAANKTALYGPFWILLSGIPFILGFGNFIITLFNFKLFVVFFYLGISYLIFKLTKDSKKVAFFALNPLVLIETAVSGHNDAVMMFFALFSLYFLKKNRHVFSIIFLAFSILIKFASVFLTPVFIYYFYMKLKKKRIDWDKIFMLSSTSMLAIFFLSPLREEIYPWYAIWFLTFVALIPKYKLLKQLSLLLSFVLLLRYIPFMYLGTYFGPTPGIKILVTFIPITVLIFVYLIKRKEKLVKILKRHEFNFKI